MTLRADAVASNLLVGYTINRVTLFALILSLGLLVDDPIVDVENIHRHFALRQAAAARGGARRGQRGPAAAHPGDAGGDRLVPAAVLHHRDDGAVHAADGAQRAVAMLMSLAGRLHGHALAGLPPAQAPADGKGDSAATRSRAGSDGALPASSGARSSTAAGCASAACSAWSSLLRSWASTRAGGRSATCR